MKNAAIVIVILAVLAGGAVAISKNTGSKTPGNSNSSTSQTSTSTPSNNAGTDQSSSAATITYSDNGFSPSTLTVQAGTAVTIKNTSSQPMQFDSDPHPEHTDDPQLNVGTIEPGESMTFTPTVKGTHGYHNHLNPEDTGTLIVQ